VRPGLVEKSVDEVGSVLDAVESAADYGLEFVEAGGSVVAKAAFLAGPGALVSKSGGRPWRGPGRRC
jgi:hypothetical protein